MGFNLVSLAITLVTDDVTRFVDYFSLSSGEYAIACRSLSCKWFDRDCEYCSTSESCAWFSVFGQKLTSDPSALKRYQKPPLPFVFSFPKLIASSEAGNNIVVNLVVIGNAIQHLEMLLNGLSKLILSGFAPVTAEIRQIACRDYQGTLPNNVITRSGALVPENLLIMSTDGLINSRFWLGSTLRIQLLSPLRLLENGHAVVRFEFGRFARSVMRRVSALAYYYGESEFDCDFKELSSQVNDAICMEEHFCYLNVKNKKKSGITGYGVYAGDFSRLLPFLIIGSYVHVGKGSSFGMGLYNLLPADCIDESILL